MGIMLFYLPHRGAVGPSYFKMLQDLQKEGDYEVHNSAVKVCILALYLEMEFTAGLMNIFLVGIEDEFYLNVILLKKSVSSGNVGLHV